MASYDPPKLTQEDRGDAVLRSVPETRCRRPGRPVEGAMNRILLIEDEASTQLLLRNRLEDLGYEVVIASTGARGLMEARAGRFDLFLVDIGLGSGIDGFEVCNRLKATPHIHSIPVVLISGQVKGQEELHRGYEAGCEAFLLKGDLTLVEDVVRAMLRIKSLQDDLALQNRLLEEQNRRLQEERQRGEDLEMALRESGSRSLVFRELAAGRPDAVVIVDGEGTVRWSDRGAREILGKEIDGRTLGALTPDSGLEAFARDARTEPREGYRFDLGKRSMTASVVPLVPRAGTNERPFKAVLLLDAGKRRVAAEMLRMEEQGTPRRELGPLLEAARWTFHPSALPGEDQKVRELRAQVSRLAHKDGPVLIVGEVGTGKEWIARSLHFSGARSGPFIPVNCSALTSDQLESELFGHTKGAHAQALADRPGLFQQASNGTLLLQNVDALSPELQGKLLGFLQDGEVYRVGSSTAEKVQTRLVATTQADLKALVDAGRFRDDLLYRLNVLVVTTTPLRERAGDIPLVARHYLRRFAAERPDLDFSGEAMWVMTRYDWPGNQREVESVVEGACASSQGSAIEVTDLSLPLTDLHKRLKGAEELPPAFATARTGAGAGRAGAGSLAALLDHENEIPLSLEFYERLVLERALRKTGGDKRESAKLLNMGKSTFYRKLKLHGIT